MATDLHEESKSKGSQDLAAGTPCRLPKSFWLCHKGR